MSTRQWRWPLVLGALTIAGLVAALLGEGGGWRLASWIALGLPLTVAAWSMARPRRRHRPRRLG